MTDDFDFTKPQPDMAAASAPFKASGSRFYNEKVAAQIFKIAGSPEQFKAEQLVFTEDSGKASGPNRMYYLVDGEVTLTIGGKPLGTLGKGEIFGEMAVITGRPRSASARAYTSCTAFSMDATQLQAALAKIPEFGLMLASVMFDRLRFVAQKLASRTKAPGSAAREATVFDQVPCAWLSTALSPLIVICDEPGMVFVPVRVTVLSLVSA